MRLELGGMHKLETLKLDTTARSVLVLADAGEGEFKLEVAVMGGEAYEKSRTPEQNAGFRYALHETMDLRYAHQGTTVYMLTELPKGTTREVGYADSGWTTNERRSAEQIKKVFLYDAKWKLVLDLGEEKGAKFPNAPISTRFG